MFLFVVSSSGTEIEPEKETSASLEPEPSLQDDSELDETSLFQEIDRELASLLSGLKARCRDAGVDPQDDLDDVSPQPCVGSSTPPFPTVMIPNGSSSSGGGGSSNGRLASATAASAQNGCSELGPEAVKEDTGDTAPSLLQPSDSFILDTWAEALGQDSLSLSSVTEELQALSAGLLALEGRSADITTGQDKPLPAGTSGDETSAPAAEGSQLSSKQTQVKADAEALSGDGSGGLLDESLEESSKILAEIPWIFTAFLDGGQPREKPPKKLRFVENREDASSSQGSSSSSAVNGTAAGEGVHREQEERQTQTSLGSTGAMEKPRVEALEDEVFRPVPEVCVLSPDSESASEHSSR